MLCGNEERRVAEALERIRFVRANDQVEMTALLTQLGDGEGGPSGRVDLLVIDGINAFHTRAAMSTGHFGPGSGEQEAKRGMEATLLALKSLIARMRPIVLATRRGASGEKQAHHRLGLLWDSLVTMRMGLGGSGRPVTIVPPSLRTMQYRIDAASVSWLST